MIADNRLAEVAVWDDRLLAEHLKALASVELAFDIETIGFDMGEIDLRINRSPRRTPTPASRPFLRSSDPRSAASATSGFWAVTGFCAATRGMRRRMRS